MGQINPSTNIEDYIEHIDEWGLTETERKVFMDIYEHPGITIEELKVHSVSPNVHISNIRLKIPQEIEINSHREERSSGDWGYYLAHYKAISPYLMKFVEYLKSGKRTRKEFIQAGFQKDILRVENRKKIVNAGYRIRRERKRGSRSFRYWIT